jgi:hypothetical protein
MNGSWNYEFFIVPGYNLSSEFSQSDAMCFIVAKTALHPPWMEDFATMKARIFDHLKDLGLTPVVVSLPAEKAMTYFVSPGNNEMRFDRVDETESVPNPDRVTPHLEIILCRVDGVAAGLEVKEDSVPSSGEKQEPV